MATKALQARHVVCTKRQVLVRAVGAAACVGRPPLSLEAKSANLKKDDFKFALGEAVVRLAGSAPGGVLVFLPSYNALHQLARAWRDARLNQRYGGGQTQGTVWDRLVKAKGAVIVEPRGDGGATTHDEAIASYKRAIATKGGALLLCVYRGKCSEGISYNDDACRLVVCVGIPYSPAFDHLVARKKAYNDAKIRGGAALGCGRGGQAPADTKVMTGQTWYPAARAASFFL